MAPPDGRLRGTGSREARERGEDSTIARGFGSWRIQVAGLGGPIFGTSAGRRYSAARKVRNLALSALDETHIMITMAPAPGFVVEAGVFEVSRARSVFDTSAMWT